MRTFLVTIVLIAVAASCRSESLGAEPPRQAYLLFPVRTQLQRELYFNRHVRYYLLVHGDSLIDADGKVDSDRLDFERLNDDLGPVRVILPGQTISASLILGEEPRPPEPAARLVNMAIMGWAREAGFDRHVPTTIGGDSVWKAAVRLAGDARGLYEEKEDEDSIGDDTVRVYPVRTALSRLISAEADCVVSFPQPYGEDATGELDEKSKERVKELVESLKLEKRSRVQFLIWMKHDVNRKAVDTFTEKTARELWRELEFENFSVARYYVR
jgi:hypothetical protein